MLVESLRNQPAGIVPDLRCVAVIAPHPDDEVIAASGLMQRVTAAGGRIAVLFLTAGERNVWAQRALFRRWRITPADRERWALLRVGEAMRGLSQLGIPPAAAEVLRFPDGRLSSFLRRDAARAVGELETRLRALAPTLIVSPSTFDLHADHRAAAFLAHRAAPPSAQIVTYVVHGSAPESRTSFRLALTAEERSKKHQAIAEHETQLILGRRRYLAYAGAAETFYRAESDLVRIPTAGRSAFDTARHGTHAAARSLFGWFGRREGDGK